VKTNIPTFTLPTTYSAIYFDSDQGNKFLTISDSGHTGGDANPNYSKLLVSTEDQTDKPIFSFRKSNISGSGTPSFYWGSTGQNSALKFKSDYEFTINSPSSVAGYLYFLARSAGFGATGNVLMSGRNFNNTGLQLYLNGPQSFTASRHFLLQSPSLSITPTQMILPGYFRTWGYFSCTPSASLDQPEGFLLSRGQTASNVDMLRFFYGPTSGLVSGLCTYLRVTQYRRFDVNALNVPQTEQIGSSFIVGSTGESDFLNWLSVNPIEGPTGPFAYHVKPSNNFSSRFGTQISTSAGAGGYYLDVSSISEYNKDVIVVNCTGTFFGNNNVYLKIPRAPAAIPNPNYYPLWGSTFCSEYRIILDYGLAVNRSRTIAGVVWDQVVFSPASNTPVYAEAAFKFTSGNCKFIDVMYKYNTGDSQVYAYIKTCNGRSFTVPITNYNPFSATTGEDTRI